jgi:transposase
MIEEDWVLVLEMFHACHSRRRDKGRDDRKFFEALHYFTVHNITWRALPAEFGSWNSIWNRFWRLSRSGVFETFFEALASLSERAHLVQMFDSTVIAAKRKAFIRKWRLECRSVADRLEEASEKLFIFTRFPKSQRKSIRTSNPIERLHEEFKRRTKTQTVLP